jgi:hypothetical protein
MNVSSDPFQNITPNAIFDFPAVAPDGSVTLDFSRLLRRPVPFRPADFTNSPGTVQRRQAS